MILVTTDQSTAFQPLAAIAIPITDPTQVCVVETGSERYVAIKSHTDTENVTHIIPNRSTPASFS